MDIASLLVAAAAGAVSGLVAVIIFDAVGRPPWWKKRKERIKTKSE